MIELVNDLDSKTLGWIFVVSLVVAMAAIGALIKSAWSSLMMRIARAAPAANAESSIERPAELAPEGEVRQHLQHCTVIYRSIEGYWNAYVKMGDQEWPVSVEPDTNLKNVAMATLLRLEVSPENGPKP
ncbi:hypothetical protein [Thalassolituus marinus]|uniref:Uncharacterized protein n=1 Tax=Thalassolituus marinus TaxID=671053 RepID=A0ABS7ZWE2_9GAMM|nr:hypothetical protein [Thalassolituus marinus]MCA6065438.1 hypothetical protein [Thalassolituus marinus]